MNYKWNLTDLKNVKNNGYKVFSFFSCGGGSSMGYKNAGFEVLGGCDIDKQMEEIYKVNFNPKYFYIQGIIEFNKILDRDLPSELFNLDILDGSPPCSTFSTLGDRDKNWGKEKKFREGQKKQVLDDLVFEYIKSVEKLKPKIFLLENVKGIIIGNAKGYVKEIIKKAENIGYDCKIFLINGATTGLPQARERIFIIGIRKDLGKNNLKLNFNKPFIYFKDIYQEERLPYSRKIGGQTLKLWNNRKFGETNLKPACGRLLNKIGGFSSGLIYKHRILPTITAGDKNILFNFPRQLNKIELCLGGSFPLDYNFLELKPQYLVGMSVPPLMIYSISKEIKEQILDKLKK